MHFDLTGGIKRALVIIEDFYYKKIIKKLLKTSKLGYGFVVTGAESGVNFEHIYNNKPQGTYLVGRFVDKALLNLPAVQATRGRKDAIKENLWNEINNNILQERKTRILDLASGSARYLRELKEEHCSGNIESVCIDKDMSCIALGRSLSEKEGLMNIRFFHGDIFRLKHLKKFSSRFTWTPNIMIASGLFIYFNNDQVETMLREIHDTLPHNGLLLFSSYEKITSKKLMRKTMAVSSGEEWVLYYRKPEFWRALLWRVGFKQIYISRDSWRMNNICSARK